MKCVLRTLLILLLFISTGRPAAAATKFTPSPELTQRVDRLLKQLEDGTFEQRESADQELLKLPIDALPLLEAAAAEPKTGADVRERLAPHIAAYREYAPAVLQLRALRSIDAAFAQQLQSEYEAHGHRGPWDRSVADGFKYRFVRTDELYGHPAFRRSTAAFRSAIAAGCDDPLVRLIMAHLRPDTDKHDDDALALIKDAPEKMETRHYSKGLTSYAYCRRAQARWLAGREQMKREDVEACRRDVKKAVDLFCEAHANDPGWPELRHWIIRELACLIVRLEPETAARDMNAALDAMLKRDDASFVIAARLRATSTVLTYVENLGVARSGVKAGNQELHGAFEAAKRAALAREFETDPVVLKARYDAAVAREDRPECARMFERLMIELPSYEFFKEHVGMAIDRQDQEVLRILSKRAERMIRPDPRIPLLVADIEWALARIAGNGVVSPEVRNNAELWARIVNIYDRYFEMFPNDVVAHGRYAWYAYQFGQYDVAVKHFDAAGDDGDDPTTYSMTTYDYARRKAAAKSGK